MASSTTAKSNCSFAQTLSLSLLATVAISPGIARGGDTVQFEDVSDLLDIEVHGRLFGGNGFMGVAWFDYNRDGWLDLFVANGCAHNDGLFRNNGDGTFTDVASDAGVVTGWGTNGVVAGDFDNDGFQDLLITGDGGFRGNCVRKMKLFYNDGDGTFTDITAAAGLVSPDTALSAALADINNDGYLDIFMCAAGDEAGNQTPNNKLYLNNGDLTFSDISASSGVDTNRGACVAMFSDYDNDGLMDLYIANCVRFFPESPMELFRNNGDLTFTDVAAAAGISDTGYWMGLAFGDYNLDGNLDIFITNLGNGFAENHKLYENHGDGTYTDVANAMGAGSFTFAWGCTMRDFDNDGYPDIYFVGNLMPGFILNEGIFLLNQYPEAFTDLTDTMPIDQTGLGTSGLATADYDNDGYLDIAVAAEADVNPTGGPLLMRNLANLKNNWLTVRLEGTTSNRDAVGARMRVVAGELSMIQEVYAGSSFLSMESQWLNFGLGGATTTDLIEVRWPSGLIEQFPNVDANQMIDLVEGESPGACLADIDGDRAVGTSDLLSLLGAWGKCAACAEDLDKDGSVGSADLIILLGSWGPCR